MVNDNTSLRTVLASSKPMPCFDRFARALSESHSNTKDIVSNFHHCIARFIVKEDFSNKQMLRYGNLKTSKYATIIQKTVLRFMGNQDHSIRQSKRTDSLNTGPNRYCYQQHFYFVGCLSFFCIKEERKSHVWNCRINCFCPAVVWSSAGGTRII